MARRRTPSFATSTCPPTTPVSRFRRPAKAQPSPPFPASTSTTSCASRRSGRSAMTIASPTARSKLQIPPSPMRPHFVKARVKVHIYADGSHAVFHAPRCIGRYDENGTIRNAKTPPKSARRRASWTAWTSLRLAHPAHEAEQKQKKRTYVVLPKPDNLIRYRQHLFSADWPLRCLLTAERASGRARPGALGGQRREPGRRRGLG